MAKKPVKKQLPAKGRSGGKGGSFDRWIVVGIIVALLAIGLTLWGPLRKYRISPDKQTAQQSKKIEPEQKKPAPEKPGKKETRETKETKGTKEAKETKTAQKPDESTSRPSDKKTFIAIVIDDLGQDIKQAREIASLPARITFAIMPGLAQSKKVAELAKQNKHEVLLHLPMEYRSGNGTPAPGMLRSDMTPMEFLTTVSDDVDSVPGAIGINNHEGSSLTENKEAMKFLMAELKARNLMFLDSFTSAKSVGFATAREFGIKSARRDVFLDNDADNPASIRTQLDQLTMLSRKNGKAIGIGHPHPATIFELRKWLAEADLQGIEIVPVSRLMQ